ncbi:MAG: hypothetical protein QOF35_1092 [Actinomycetota bacterium]|nr:hypothetical protein [Actinomycetota bacterium]
MSAGRRCRSGRRPLSSERRRHPPEGRRVQLGARFPILRLTWGMALVLQDVRDVRRASEAQRLGKGISGNCWYDGSSRPWARKTGRSIWSPKLRCERLVARKAVGERPDDAIQLVTLELVRACRRRPAQDARLHHPTLRAACSASIASLCRSGHGHPIDGAVHHSDSEY